MVAEKRSRDSLSPGHSVPHAWARCPNRSRCADVRCQLSLHVKVGVDKSVIRRPYGAPRFDVHFKAHAPFRHWPRCQDVVEPPAFIVFKRARPKVIPEGELLAVGIEMSEDIDKAPRKRVFVSATD